MAIDIVLKLLSQGADKAKADVKSVKGEVTGLGTEATKTTTETDKIAPSLSDAAEQGNKLSDTLTRLRNGGAILAGIGAAGLAIANHFAEAAIEADGLGSKMEALLRGQGMGDGAVNKVKELALQLALATGEDDDMLASGIAEAVASGRVMRLRQYGIVVDKLGQQAITAAQGVSAQAGAQEALNQVLKAAIPAIQTLRDTSSAAALAAGEFDVRWGNIEETIGEGTGVIKAGLYNNVLSPLLDIAEANPELIQTGGAVFAIGAAGAAGLGGLIAMGSQIGLMIISLNAMGITSVASFGKMATAALATRAGVFGLYTAITLISVAAAFAAASVAYSAGQNIGWISKELTFVDSLKLGWLAVADAITGAKNAGNARNEIDFKAEEAKIKAQYAQDRQAGMSEESAGKKRDDALLKLNQTYAKEANRVNDNAGLIKHQDQIDLLEKTTSPIAAPSMPAAPQAPALPAMPAMPQVPAIPSDAPANTAGMIDTSGAETNARGMAMGQVMAQASSWFTGRAHSTINSDGTVTEYPGPGGGNAQPQKITLKPKTRVTQNSGGDYVVEILPEKFVIPNDFGRAVGAL